MEQPPLVDASYINLIFDMRNLIEDQNFRMARLEQRLDMFLQRTPEPRQRSNARHVPDLTHSQQDGGTLRSTTLTLAPRFSDVHTDSACGFV
jgi:hypothetical protein